MVSLAVIGNFFVIRNVGFLSFHGIIFLSIAVSTIEHKCSQEGWLAIQKILLDLPGHCL